MRPRIIRSEDDYDDCLRLIDLLMYRDLEKGSPNAVALDGCILACGQWDHEHGLFSRAAWARPEAEESRRFYPVRTTDRILVHWAGYSDELHESEI